MQRSVFVAMVAFLTPYDIIKLYLFFPKIVKSYIPLKRGNFVHNLLSKTVKEKYSVLKVFFLVLLFFGTNVFLSFSTDSYSTLSAGFHTAAQDMLERNGRPIIALIYKLHSLSGLPGISFYYISSGLALLFLGIAVWLYQKLLARYSLPENIRILLAFASIANIYIIEYFMFIEKCGFMLAILFNVIAVQSICGFFERKNTHLCNVSLLCAVLAMTLAVFTYQGTVALFVVLSIPFAFYHAKNFREYVCNIISIGVCYAVPVLLAFAAFKWVFNGTRLQTDFNLLANLKEFFGGLWMCNMETFDIFPHYIFLLAVLLILAAAVISARGTDKPAFLEKLHILVLFAAACVFPAATILQGSGWWTPRTVYPLASIAGVLAINSFINHPIQPDSTASVCIAKRVSIAAIAVLLVVQYFGFTRLYIDKYKLNALDESRCCYVGQAISEYEETSGIEIRKIAFYTDAESAIPTYPHLYSHTGDLICSSFNQSWSDLSALNYYLGTNYEKVDPVEKYDIYFSEKNWDHLSQGQLIFDGDTLHLCIY